jgi:hypothetical protein
MIRYIEVEDADVYVQTYKIDRSEWESASTGSKEIWLNKATRALDSLVWKGIRANQTNAFPRGSETDIPQDILDATAELAFAYSCGVNPDLEFDNLSITSRKLGPVSTTSDTTIPKVFVILGIVSLDAYRLIAPYLQSQKLQRIERV